MTAIMKQLSKVLQQTDRLMQEVLSGSLQALNCELLTGMALDFGACFPTVRVRGLQRPHFALGRAAEPLAWRARFYPQIDFVFLVLAPAPTTKESQRLAATLHWLGRDRLHLNELGASHSAEEMLAALTHYPLLGEEQLALPQPHFGDVSYSPRRAHSARARLAGW
jgi:mannitol/fructose-specific phosphotransferase system IIA component (Ntr-type)